MLGSCFGNFRCPDPAKAATARRLNHGEALEKSAQLQHALNGVYNIAGTRKLDDSSEHYYKPNTKTIVFITIAASDNVSDVVALLIVVQ